MAIIQLNITNAKYKGYERLLKNTDETKFAKIIQENKDWISELMEKKNQTVNIISSLVADLNAIIEEVQSVGEK